MSRQIAFWILILLALVLGGISRTSAAARAPWAGGTAELCLLLAILVMGWEVFGQPIQD